MLVVGRRNTEIAGKCPSSVDETLDLPKIIRHPWMKAKKRQKIPVIRGWKQKNSLKMAFSPYEKRKNNLKTAFSPYGKRKNNLKTAFSPYGKAERLMLELTSRIYSFLNAASNAWFSVFVPIVMRRQFSQCSMCAQLCTAIP